jgi:hypothetical protein
MVNSTFPLPFCHFLANCGYCLCAKRVIAQHDYNTASHRMATIERKWMRNGAALE